MQHQKHQDTLRLFQSRLDQIIDLEHALVKLARAIDWSVFAQAFGAYYSEGQGRPAKSTRLLVGIHYLKHAFNESDESVVERFLENPYWQYFCGFEYFQHEWPLDPTTLVKWRQRVGGDQMELLLKETIATAKRQKLLRASSLARLNVDTTVEEKAIAYPTDAGLYYKLLLKLLRAAQARQVKLRQSYRRKGKAALVQQGYYRRAQQHKRAARLTRKLKGYVGRVVRDVQRKVESPDPELKELLALAARLLQQERHSTHKLYSLHAPEVECISKGKAHKKYEFGCKVGVTSTSRGNWIIGIKSFPGNPYDGHTLQASMEQAEKISGVAAQHIHVDRGYRGHDYTGGAEVNITGGGGKKKSRGERFWRRRRTAIEPVISHVKHDNRMSRNHLKGGDGDQINAILAACGYNLRKLFRGVAASPFFIFCCVQLRKFLGSSFAARHQKLLLPATSGA